MTALGVDMVEKLKQKKSKPRLAIARHIKITKLSAARREVRKPNVTDKNHFILNASIIQDKLDSALGEAIELYKNSANRLGIEVDVDKCKSSRRDLDNLATIKRSYDAPENRQLIGAYVSAREALHDLNKRVEKAKIFDGDMTLVDISHLLDSFRLLGIASYCIFDEYLREDFEEIEKRGVKQGFKAHLIAAEYLPKENVLRAPSYTDIASRNSWIKSMHPIVGSREIIRLWDKENPGHQININTIKNALRVPAKVKKGGIAKDIQSERMNAVIRMGKSS